MRLGAAPTLAFPVQLLLWAHAPVGPAPHDSVFLACPSENEGPVDTRREHLLFLRPLFRLWRYGGAEGARRGARE